MKPPAFIRTFCFRMGLFFLPVAVLFAFPLWVLWAAGELTSVDRIVEKQQRSPEPVLVGLAYSNPEKYFKLRSFLTRRSDVVVLGNSHMMAFRGEFFKNKKFYNAAVGGSRLPDFKNFVDHIPAGMEPKVLIAGLDPFFAKPDFDWSKKGEERFEREAGALGAVRILGSAWKSVYRDYSHGKFDAQTLSRASHGPGTAIGLEALMRDSGFLKDGSHVDTKESSAFSGEVPDYSNLKRGESFDAQGLRYLKEFLEACRRRGIHVIGILPPTREAVYEQLCSTGYRYWEDLPQVLGPVFKKYGYSFYDFSRPSLYGGTNDEFYDDFHASETAFQRIAGKLTASEKGLRA